MFLNILLADESAAWKNKVVGRLRQGIQHLMKVHGIKVIYGKGRIKDKNTVVVAGGEVRIPQ